MIHELLHPFFGVRYLAPRADVAVHRGRCCERAPTVPTSRFSYGRVRRKDDDRLARLLPGLMPAEVICVSEGRFTLFALVGDCPHIGSLRPSLRYTKPSTRFNWRFTLVRTRSSGRGELSLATMRRWCLEDSFGELTALPTNSLLGSPRSGSREGEGASKKIVVCRRALRPSPLQAKPTAPHAL